MVDRLQIAVAQAGFPFFRGFVPCGALSASAAGAASLSFAPPRVFLVVSFARASNSEVPGSPAQRFRSASATVGRQTLRKSQ